MKSIYYLLLTAVLVIPAIAGAQTERIELFGGLSLSKFAVSDPDYEAPKQLARLTVGVRMLFPQTEAFGWQAEAMITQKGYRYEESGADLGYYYYSEGSAVISYIEMPVLARMSFGTQGSGVVPFLLAGPALALKIGCRYEFVTVVAAGGYNDSSSDGGSCESAEDAPSYSSVDLGIVLGGGLEYRNLSFHVRYDIGLTEVLNERFAPEVRNRALMLLAGIRVGGAR